MSSQCVVAWHDGHEGYRCGYCKSPDTNYSHGMSAYNLTVNDYQDLIDRGWRRSGTYVYKPTMKKTCCPQYPIRCDALAFNMSRSHKKVIKRVNKYLNFGTIPDKDEHCDDVSHPSAPDYPRRDLSTANVNIESGNEVPTLATVDRKLSPEAVENTSVVAAAAAAVQNSGVEDVKHHQPKPGVGADPTKPKCMKAKLQRLEKKQLKAKTVVPTPDAVQTDCLKKTKVTEKKSLEDHLGDIIDTPVHKLEIQLVRSSPASEEFEGMYDESGTLFKKYQIVIHKEDEDDCSESTFASFLVESPLQAKDAVLPHGFGSFHQNYILDGKIIAVGVIDILPKCVSSVYLYYDPDYSFLSLGTYSALRELALTRELHRICPDISYYYLGFYIHSCPKMRYKGQYDPSYLLCPETYSWHKIDECRKKLDVQKYSRFAEAGIDDKDSDVEVDNVLVLHQRQVMTYGAYRSKKSRVTDKKSVSLYAHLVGNALTKRICLYRS